MPYIKEDRAFFICAYDLDEEDIVKILGERIATAGELNYVITKLMIARLNNIGISYENIRGVAADATEAANEFRRRLLATYEDVKMSDPLNVDPYQEVIIPPELGGGK